MFFKIRVLKNFANFTGKHLCWSLFLKKFLTLFLTLLKTLQYRCFPVKFAKKFKNNFFYFPPVAASDSGMLSALQLSIFLVSSFIKDLFISFQQKNEIKK